MTLIPDLYMNPNLEMKIEANVQNPKNAKVNRVQKDDFKFFDKLKSGLHSNKELDTEWSSWVGDSKGLKISQLELSKQKLTMIVTEISNLASKPLSSFIYPCFCTLIRRRCYHYVQSGT